MTTIRTETETTVTTGLHRRVKVTHNEHGIYLLLEDMAPDDLRDGPQMVSARLTGNESRTIADALTGTTDHHDRTESAFTLSDLADLRARWANETQGYDPGGLLTDTLPRARWPRAPYVEQFAPTDPDRDHWQESYRELFGKFVRLEADRRAETDDLRAALNDALARAIRAEDSLARIREAIDREMEET